MARTRPGHSDARTQRVIRARSIAVALGASALMGALGACATTEVQTQGDSRTQASYTLPKLTASLPEWVTPRAVAAAAEQTLRDRGYSVLSSAATTDSVKVVAKAPGTGPLKKHVVRASWNRSGSTVTVKSEPFGDETRSRAILDGILARLGL